MSKTEYLKTVKDKIKEIEAMKAKDQATVKTELVKARELIDAAENEIQIAVAKMNADAYQDAQDKKRKAETLYKMHSDRNDQITNKLYISESESDGIIEGLLDYEEQLAADFRVAAKDLIGKLSELCDSYSAAVSDTENTIHKWESDIHPYYKSPWSSRLLPDGTRTDRMEEPCPVHRIPYRGCSEFLTIDEFIRQDKNRSVKPLFF